MRTRLTSLVAVLAIVATACGSSASTATAVPTAVPTVALTSLAPVGHGSCAVEMTGAQENVWQSQDASLLVSYWLSGKDRQAAGLKGEMFILSCGSDTGTVSFTMHDGTTATQFPKAAGDYVVAVNGAVAAQLSMTLTLPDKSVWAVSAPGVFKVATFAGGEFSGNFEVSIVQKNDDLSTQAIGAVISGTFDLTCTGSSCS